jgi:hypothetical protein
MPDWTYVPLHGLTARLFGVDRSRRLALAAVGAVTLLPCGRSIVRAFGFTVEYPAAQRVMNNQVLASPIGLVIADVSAHTVIAVQSMGFGFVGSEVPPGAVVSDAIDFDALMADVRVAPGVVIANAATIALGPAIAARVNEALEHDARVVSEALPIQTFRPWTWPAWLWAMWLGIAMVCAGVGAAIISLGPVLLPYDREFLNMSTDGLMATNSRLVQFLQHDRITMAGAMIAIGCNDIGLAFAMRRGWAWARAGFIAAGACGFPTFFLFLGYRFFDPLHFAVAIGFFPLFLLGCFGSRVPPKWAPTPSPHESVRRRALVGQLMMIAVAAGITCAGIAIMVIGIRSVFIPSDIAYLESNRPTLETALNGRLQRFVAHDRAGFGGALMSLGVGVLCTSLWGWRSGERSTYWTLLASSGIGFFAAIIVHMWVGYTDFGHLLPVYLGVVMVGVALLLSRDWFLVRPIGLAATTPNNASGFR